MFWAEIWKISEFFISKFSFFGGKIFSIFEQACFLNVLGNATNAQRKVWSDCADAQTGLNFRWVYMPESAFYLFLVHLMHGFNHVRSLCNIGNSIYILAFRMCNIFIWLVYIYIKTKKNLKMSSAFLVNIFRGKSPLFNHYQSLAIFSRRQINYIFLIFQKKKKKKK